LTNEHEPVETQTSTAPDEFHVHRQDRPQRPI
jgi:hypothetical protein